MTANLPREVEEAVHAFRLAAESFDTARGSGNDAAADRALDALLTKRDELHRVISTALTAAEARGAERMRAACVEQVYGLASDSKARILALPLASLRTEGQAVNKGSANV